MLEALKDVQAAVSAAAEAPFSALRARLLAVASKQHRVNVAAAVEIDRLEARVRALEEAQRAKGD